MCIYYIRDITLLYPHTLVLKNIECYISISDIYYNSWLLS